MTPLAAGVAALLLVVLPVAVDRWAVRRASPAALVALALAALGGLLLLPLALAACLGLRSAHGAPAARPAALVGAVALGALTGGRALLTWARVRRAWRSIGTAVDSSRISASGKVAVVPLAEPTAFVAGRRLVVSAALLEALPEEEAGAVLAHEEAHLHGGHPRVAMAAQALSRGVFRIPPARRAEARLRHELEVLADAEATRRLGDSASVAAALATLGDPDPMPGVLGCDNEAVADRIDRLVGRAPPSPWADRLVLAGVALAGGASLVTVCAAFHTRFLFVGVLACTVVTVVYLAMLRPLRAAAPRRP